MSVKGTSLFFVCAQNELDSLQTGLKSTINRIERFNYQYGIGRYYYTHNKLDSAVMAYKRAFEIAPKNDFAIQAKALNAIGWSYHMSEDLDNTILFYDLSYKAYLRAGAEPEVLADVLKDLGRAYYGFAQYDSAMSYYMRAQEIYESNNIISEGYGTLQHYIGSVFKRQDQMDKACEYYYKEIEYGREHTFPPTAWTTTQTGCTMTFASCISMKKWETAGWQA